ncbi:interferon-related developmental regulator 1-like [Impatiens glandulifera]|uniref:interferon-related developmental regulator 1-like n=1 Tax=Impatiens glandulifera TaxID=253017 RepID=UPI001FB17260|nr:interferon-related developmental regulator 1-like [Impatiens glandulifera]
MMDIDDDDSVSSWSMKSDQMILYRDEEIHVDNDRFLDQHLDSLYEKRSSTRENALSSIIEGFNSDLQHEFVDRKFATLLHQCLNCIKRGSAREISLASHVIGLLALITGPGDKATEIFRESVTPISQALKTGFEASKTCSLLYCLAIITFVGGNEPEETEASMQLMWQVIHPKLGSNVVATKPSMAIITGMVISWSFLLTTMDGQTLDSKTWQGSISYLSTLLEKDDRPLRIAAGESLALIFEIGSLEKFCNEAKGHSNGSHQERRESVHIQGMRSKILNQVRNLAAEAGGKGSIKKDLNRQRNSFRDIMEFIENGYTPETCTKIGGDSLKTFTWSQLIQLNFMKHFLGGGFIKHMQENEFVHEIFDFEPKRKLLDDENLTCIPKRWYKSPNSAMSKTRTQTLNKQRMQSQDRNVGHFAVGFRDE